LVDAIITSHQASLSQAKFSLEYPPPHMPSPSSLSTTAKEQQKEQEEAVVLQEPMSELFYPIIPNMVMNGGNSNSIINKNLDILLLRQNAVVTGILSMSFYWRHYLYDLLPSTFDGLTLVLQSQCQHNGTSTNSTNSSSPSSVSSFTYQINGPSAQFLGVGDRHETRFNDMEQSAWLTRSVIDDENGAITGIPMNEDHCPFLVRVYPSQVMKSRYTTNSPITLTMASILVFVLTSALFIVYDCWVERRQRKILQKAVHSIAIVSSLFPSVVRDRIFPFASASTLPASSSRSLLGTENAVSSAEDTPRNRLKGIMRRTSSVGGSTESSQKQDMMSIGGVVSDYSKPVAELFPDSTVLFSDIAGFTAWR
jgi:hypothetical protein